VWRIGRRAHRSGVVPAAACAASEGGLNPGVVARGLDSSSLLRTGLSAVELGS
jgi:hypothetical protein